ncbi:MAG: NADH-quinone oxidoreductase subunit A [Anaerolineae bacterium]|nr:NADH-quinone oxidoreductase subunit A [Anaerolineae bacterium]
MLQDYLPIGVLLAVSALLAVFAGSLSRFIGPYRPNRRKLMPYESGMDPIGPAMRRIPVKFYLVAVLFILFDIEVVFFLPWAVLMRQLGLFGLVEMIVFIAILLVGYVYAWRKGALQWE